MLNEKELNKYLVFEHNVAEIGRDYISQCRTDIDSRMIGVTARSNICSWYLSEKMGHTVSSESRGPEKSFILFGEYDERVLEIWSQPQPVKVCRTNKNNKKNWGSYTADFLVITKAGPKVIEVKDAAEIKQLILKNPDDWERLSETEVQYVPAIEAFEKIGLKHEVFVYSEDMRYLVANLEMMVQSRKSERLSNKLKTEILNMFEQSFGWSLYDLKEALNLSSYTPIIQLIDDGYLFVNSRDELLSQPESCMVAKSEVLAGEAKALRGRVKIYNEKDKGPYSITKIPSHAYAEEILIKLKRIEAGETGSNITRWKKIIREGSEKGLTDFQSLIPLKHLRGNRKSKLGTHVEKCLNDFLINEYANSQGISDYRSYINYRVIASEYHPYSDPVSRKTFIKKLLQIPPEVIAYKRGGKRAANAVVEPTDPSKRSLKSQLAWQSAAIDHYLADIYLIVNLKNEVFVMRPWLTAMIDLATSTILAVTISFSSPSKKSDAKVMRDCVRRHGRLPSEIIVDRGSDFKSVYFAALLAHFGITYSLRPSSHSRFGGEIEGFFGEFKKIWLCQRKGNVADYKNSRAVDGKFSPKKTATLKPYDFYKELLAFCSWRENQCNGARIISPQIQKENNERDYPFIGVPVEYNDEFILATAVDYKEYKVDFKRGLHIGRFWYWHPNISKVRGKKRKLEVRIDPENPYVVYALIDNAWVTCSNSQLNLFSAKDHVSQFVEGLLQLDAAEVRQSEKLEADELVVKMMREMDSLTENIPIINIDQSDDKQAVSVFKNIKKSAVEPIEIRYWGNN